MPTNILRSRSSTTPHTLRDGPARARERLIEIIAGRITVRARLLETLTAERIWAMLPLHSTTETWGESIHFETPAETGREADAQSTVTAGEICFWSEEDRVIVAFGPTPISGPAEIRLPMPCNVWAIALDDVTHLKTVTPGEKVSLRSIEA